MKSFSSKVAYNQNILRIFATDFERKGDASPLFYYGFMNNNKV